MRAGHRDGCPCPLRICARSNRHVRAAPTNRPTIRLRLQPTFPRPSTTHTCGARQVRVVVPGGYAHTGRRRLVNGVPRSARHARSGVIAAHWPSGLACGSSARASRAAIVCRPGSGGGGGRGGRRKGWGPSHGAWVALKAGGSLGACSVAVVGKGEAQSKICELLQGERHPKPEYPSRPWTALDQLLRG